MAKMVNLVLYVFYHSWKKKVYVKPLHSQFLKKSCGLSLSKGMDVWMDDGWVDR